MENKSFIHTVVFISLTTIIVLACGTVPPAAESTVPEPTHTQPLPAPTATIAPPTNTPTPPTPTATPFPVVINADNIQAVSDRYELWVPEDSVRALAFSPDSSLLVTGTGLNLSSPDQKLRIYHVETGTLITESEKLYTIIWDVAFTPDGSMIAVALDNGSIQIRNTEDLSLADKIELPGPVNSISLSSDGKRIAAGVAEAESDDGVVYIWDLDNREILLKFWAHPYSVPSMDFSPDGKLLATGAVDRSVKVWDSQTGALMDTLSQAGQGAAIKFSPDGSLLASGLCSESINLDCQKGSVILWDSASWGISRILTGPGDWVDGVAFTPNMSILAGASRNGLVYLWRLSDGTLLHTLGGHTYGVDVIAVSSDGSSIATGAHKSAIIWVVEQ
ncbi:MAG: WD40 repeat domain-containing protein [Anaerolineales bacterium]